MGVLSVCAYINTVYICSDIFIDVSALISLSTCKDIINFIKSIK